MGAVAAIQALALACHSGEPSGCLPLRGGAPVTLPGSVAAVMGRGQGCAHIVQGLHCAGAVCSAVRRQAGIGGRVAAYTYSSLLLCLAPPTTRRAGVRHPSWLVLLSQVGLVFIAGFARQEECCIASIVVSLWSAAAAAKSACLCAGKMRHDHHLSHHDE